MKYLFLGVKVTGRNLSCAWLRPAEGVCVASLWAGDGVACACAVPLEDEVERVLRVVWCAGVVCFVPVDVVRALINARDGDGRVPITHGECGTDGEVVLNVVAVDVHLLAGFLVNESGVLVGVEVVVGADPHFTYLCERGALGCGVGFTTAEVFVDIGYTTGIECIFGRARWLKTRRTGLSSRALLTFWT